MIPWQTILTLGWPVLKKKWPAIRSWIILAVGKVHWKGRNFLTEDDKKLLRDSLKPNYYIILTRRRNHLSTFFTGLANYLLQGKWGFWSHALMNAEDEVKSVDDFRLVEAVGVGVKYTPFDEVFDVNSVVLLKPKNMSDEYWTDIMDRLKEQIGKKYDTLFDIASDKELSCVELVRVALMAEPNYAENFANFEAMIVKNKNLTPQMFYDCPDFEHYLEIYR